MTGFGKLWSVLVDLFRGLLSRNPASPAPPPPPASPPTSPPPSLPAPSDVVTSLLALHNAYRARNGLAPLVLHPELIAAAQAHSDDMATHQFMGHQGSDGLSPFDRIRRTGYTFAGAGENVAAGFPDTETVVQGWINSPGHRQNILGNWLHTGFGVATDAAGRRYWTAVFASPTVRTASHLPAPLFGDES